MIRRILSVIRKEFIHISRDFRTLVIVIVMPIAMLFLYGFAINMEIQNIETVVLDHDRSPASSALIRKFQGSSYFTVRLFDGPESELERFFVRRTARMSLIIPQDFSRGLARNPATEVQILVDASDPNAAHAIRNYAQGVVQIFNQERGFQPITIIEPRIWYNPTMKSAYFFVPGLAALILIMISTLLTSIAIVREKETGTMEQILVSPVRPAEIIIGKVIPYIVLAFADLLLILALARLVFDVPFVGNLGLLLFASLLYIFFALSLGLLISTRVPTQQVAMMAALMATLLPTVLLSGFIFPLASMPKALQLISHLVPARYYLVIIRGILLKGNTLTQLLPQMAVLLGGSLVLLAVSVKRFRLTLES